MKNERIVLADWLGDTTDGYIDIPWPRVHEIVGYHAIAWINSQSPNDVQLILEKAEGNLAGMQRLCAEFYTPALRTEFALRFAK